MVRIVVASTTSVFAKQPYRQTIVTGIPEDPRRVFPGADEAHTFLTEKGYISHEYWTPGPMIKAGHSVTFAYYKDIPDEPQQVSGKSFPFYHPCWTATQGRHTIHFPT